jgi:hypothetical protein
LTSGSQPAELYIGSLPDPRLRLRIPLRVTVEEEDGVVSVWNSELEEVGYGSNRGAAVQDFQQTLVELYRTLENDQDRLGPEMERVWGLLQQLLDERG